MDDVKKTFVIFFAPGTTWIAGKTSREQAHWTEHAAFMDALFEDGVVSMGGPFVDYSSIMVVLEASNESEIRDLFKRDPFVIHGEFLISSIHEWLVFLDARKKGE
ncbi:MAG: hypothetical protein NVS3B14_00320 [Ktedonobacteraceae bacterium]